MSQRLNNSYPPGCGFTPTTIKSQGEPDFEFLVIPSCPDSLVAGR
jgi:hypothetical protein